MFTVDHTPHLKRSSVPDHKARLNLAAALHFMTVMRDRDPSLYEAQEDNKEMLLPPSTTAALAKDLMYADSGLVNKEASYFYEEERVTLLVALQYYNELIADVGPIELMASLQNAPQFRSADAFSYHDVAIMNQRELQGLFNQINNGASLDALSRKGRLQHKESRKVDNPHQGITIDDSELDWLNAQASNSSPAM